MEIRADHSSIAKELEASQRDEKELETFIETKQKELEEWKADVYKRQPDGCTVPEKVNI